MEVDACRRRDCYGQRGPCVLDRIFVVYVVYFFVYLSVAQESM